MTMNIVKKNNMRKAIYSASKNKIPSSPQCSDEETPLAQTAKKALKQLSMTENSIQDDFGLEDWSKVGYKTASNFTHSGEGQPIKARQPTTGRFMNKSPMIKKVVVDRKNLYYLKNPTKKFQPPQTEPSQRNRSYSAIKLGYDDIRCDKIIHSTKQGRKDSKHQMELFRQTVEKSTICDFSYWKKRTTTEGTMRLTHKQREKQEGKAARFIQPAAVEKKRRQNQGRKYTFGVLLDEKAKEVPKLEHRNRPRDHSRKASLICYLVRSQMKRVSQKEGFKQRRMRLKSQKGLQY